MRNPDEPVINPKVRLAAKGVSSDRYDFPIALFSCFKGMADTDWWLAHSKAYGAKRIVHHKLDESYRHWGKIIQWPMSVWNIESDGLPIVFVGPILGGTWCAIALEELRALGLKYVIGISACGSFSDGLRCGDLVLCDRAIISDGTSRCYTEEEFVEPSSELLRLTEDLCQSKGMACKKACLWTSDALYRETWRAREGWHARGAQAVTMESAPLYAVSKALGVQAINIAYVSDTSLGGTWDGWGGLSVGEGRQEATGKTDERSASPGVTGTDLSTLECLCIDLARRVKKDLL